jgi:hypothetical protein
VHRVARMQQLQHPQQQKQQRLPPQCQLGHLGLAASPFNCNMRAGLLSVHRTGFLPARR